MLPTGGRARDDDPRASEARPGRRTEFPRSGQRRGRPRHARARDGGGRQSVAQPVKFGFTAAGTQRLTVRVKVRGFVPLALVKLTLMVSFDVATGVGSRVVTRVAVLFTVTRLASRPLT